VTWVFNADRLMEFPTAMLGVALGVVLMPQLAGARAPDDAALFGHARLGLAPGGAAVAMPCAIALLVFAQPLVAVLFHNGAFGDADVKRTTLALMGYGVGLIGIVAIKVLAPGYYASRTRARRC
jgi:putative peptidoglycan lipid II flippase